MRASSPNHPSVDREIVGYVADAVYSSPREPVPPTMYIPIPQEDAPSTMSISVRAAGGSPALLSRSLAAALTAVNADIAVTLRPMQDQMNAALTQERLVVMMSGFFGGLALLLAALGLYGVTTYAVSRRRDEIGIRMALGAAPSSVLRLVLIRVGLLVGLGVAIGTGASLWAASFVSTLLFGLQPRDPLTLVMAAGVLLIVGGVAGRHPWQEGGASRPVVLLRQSGRTRRPASLRVHPAGSYLTAAFFRTRTSEACFAPATS